MCKYSPPTLTGLTFHWRLDETQERSLHGQLRHVGGMCRWLGIAFPDMPGQWLGQTVVLASQDGTMVGTQNENVAFYSWDADFLAAIVPLGSGYQTLTGTYYQCSTTGDTTTIVSFTKLLDENRALAAREASQPAAAPLSASAV